MFLLPIILGLLLLLSSTQITPAAVEGKSYYFTTSWTDSYEENEILLYTNTLDAWFRIDALNISTDILYYDYEGYHISEGSEVEFSSEAIYFQDQHVEFDLGTFDPDNDSYSLYAYISVDPTDVGYAPGRFVFVNPTWSTHESDWQASIDLVEDNPTVESSTFNAPGDGTFSFSIAVNVESIWYIDDNPENATGITRFDFSATYDDDGVLNTYSLSTTRTLSNENFTSRLTSSRTVLRTSGPGASGDITLSTTLIAVGIAVPISILIGALLAKKFWS